jgi:hypothetical protein
MKLTTNMSMFDRASRFAMGAILIALSCYGFDVVPVHWLSEFMFWFGVINILSSCICWCFMYSIVGISTKVKDEDEFS